jgi:hypothetical protein
MKTSLCFTILIVGLSFANQLQASVVVWDFEDGTLQGWEPGLGDYFWGNLFITTGGNPGYCMVATDTRAGGSLLAKAPIDSQTDLSIYGGISWDEWVPNRGSQTTVRTQIFLEGSDGTLYGEIYTPSTIPLAQWYNRFVSFEPTNWQLSIGNASFETVLENVSALYISMDTSVWSGPSWVESYVDNVYLIPEPTTILILGLGGLSLLRRTKLSAISF